MGFDYPESSILKMSKFLGMFSAFMQNDVGERIFNRQFDSVSKLTSSLQSSSCSQLGPPIEAANGSEKYQICPLVVVTLGDLETCQTCPNPMISQKGTLLFQDVFKGE